MIVLSSCDAGGAQILSSWASRKKNKYYCILSGPAKKIYKEKLKKFKIIKNLKSVKKSKPSCYICSTSWESRVEIQNLIYAKKNNIYSIVYFDHWSNYDQRLIFKNKKILPNEIWVNDIHAYRLAKKFYPSIKIKIKINHYLNQQIKKIKMVKNNFSKSDIKKRKNILYLTEPVKTQAKKLFKNKNYWGFNEYDLINLFFKHINKIAKSYNVIVRVHPSEKKAKYGKYKKKLGFVFSKNKDILDDIAWSDIIVGLDSMAMVIGLKAKKKIFTTLPFEKKKITLPFKKINRIIDL